MADYADWAGTKALSSFTSYFGTSINGAEITWYNDPSGDAASTDKTELKIEWVQKLQSQLYIYWSNDPANSDADYFTGTWAINDAGVFTAATNDYTMTAVDLTSPVNHAKADIIWQMQFKNPVTTDAVQYDGFFAAAKSTVTWDSAATETPPSAIKFEWRDATVSDLIPA